MRTSLLFCMLVTVLQSCLNLAGGSPIPEARPDAEITDLLYETGKMYDLQQMPLFMASSYGEKFRSLRDDLRVKLEMEVDDAFNADVLLPRIRSRIAAQYNRPLLLECIAFSKTKLAIKFRNGERKGREVGFLHSWATVTSSLEPSPIATSRLALWESLDRLLHDTDSTVSAFTAMKRFSHEVAEADLRPELRTSEAALDVTLHDEERKYRFLCSSTYARAREHLHADLTDEELGQYLRFLRTQAGQWYVDVYLSAIREALLEAERSCFKHIMKVLPGTQR